MLSVLLLIHDPAWNLEVEAFYVSQNQICVLVLGVGHSLPDV